MKAFWSCVLLFCSFLSLANEIEKRRIEFYIRQEGNGKALHLQAGEIEEVRTRLLRLPDQRDEALLTLQAASWHLLLPREGEKEQLRLKTLGEYHKVIQGELARLYKQMQLLNAPKWFEGVDQLNHLLLCLPHVCLTEKDSDLARETLSEIAKLIDLVLQDQTIVRGEVRLSQYYAGCFFSRPAKGKKVELSDAEWEFYLKHASGSYRSLYSQANRSGINLDRKVAADLSRQVLLPKIVQLAFPKYWSQCMELRRSMRRLLLRIPDQHEALQYRILRIYLESDLIQKDAKVRARFAQWVMKGKLERGRKQLLQGALKDVEEIHNSIAASHLEAGLDQLEPARLIEFQSLRPSDAVASRVADHVVGRALKPGALDDKKTVFLVYTMLSQYDSYCTAVSKQLQSRIAAQLETCSADILPLLLGLLICGDETHARSVLSSAKVLERIYTPEYLKGRGASFRLRLHDALLYAFPPAFCLSKNQASQLAIYQSDYRNNGHLFKHQANLAFAIFLVGKAQETHDRYLITEKYRRSDLFMHYPLAQKTGRMEAAMELWLQGRIADQKLEQQVVAAFERVEKPSTFATLCYPNSEYAVTNMDFAFNTRLGRITTLKGLWLLGKRVKDASLRKRSAKFVDAALRDFPSDHRYRAMLLETMFHCGNEKDAIGGLEKVVASQKQWSLHASVLLALRPDSAALTELKTAIEGSDSDDRDFLIWLLNARRKDPGKLPVSSLIASMKKGYFTDALHALVRLKEAKCNWVQNRFSTLELAGNLLFYGVNRKRFDKMAQQELESLLALTATLIRIQQPAGMVF